MSITQHPQIWMVQLWLRAPRMLELGRMLHLPLSKTSSNYLVHCALSELFQKQAPKVFSLEDEHRTAAQWDTESGRLLPVLCYSNVDKQALQLLAQGFASPTVYDIVNWERVAAKPMPEFFPENMKLSFELRTQPVMRKASNGEKWKKGQEIDVFLSKVWQTGDPNVELNREEIYTEWLRQLFARQGGAEIETVGVQRFSLERMSRRNHEAKRKVTLIQRPDVTFNGILKVKNSSLFSRLLEQGLGRHKSFGFGMLKIRRAP
ncbi:MAG: subtype I-E CRISPR-associated protein CasE [Bacteroidetes bacterium HLUCCA01]|nr:MAG: subtype I-E CRISPR-associated protein CasE [Bacteroidetes bacterium HLUCCA01]